MKQAMQMNVKQMAIAVNLALQLAPSDLWGQALHVSGLFAYIVKTLEEENTQKEQGITSLSHKNQVLEGEVEKLESSVKTYKDEATGGAAASSQVEAMQRKIQVLEEEAEESDRTIRELNEK